MQWRERVGAYVGFTKPRIIELLLITTVPAMFLAQRGLPPLGLILATLVGGTLAAASANTINCVYDRDIDERMGRTSKRALARHLVSAASALRFGVVLGVAGFALLWATVNLLSALLATSAILFYVFVYTMGLKRRTTQNIVIGGAAGAVPVLVGWSAVTGTVGWPAWIMFAVIFMWTPAHFWALSLRYEDDYRKAGVPMLPVVRGHKVAAQQILVYAVLTVVTTLLLLPAAHMGVLYTAAAVLLGAGFVWQTVQLLRNRTLAQAMRVFGYSNIYLALLFLAIAADSVVHVAL